MLLAPSKIVLHKKSKQLELEFSGKSWRLNAEYLRVYSPSAEVKGHGPGQEVLQLNKQNVGIARLEPQGNYGIRIHFDDGHNTGIYHWHYLQELAQQHDKLWQDYLQRVDESQAKRNDSPGSAVKWVDPS